MGIHGDIIRVVHSAEHTQLPELGHTRQKCETDIGIAGLDDAVEALQDVAVFLCSSSLPMVASIGLSYSSTRMTTCWPVC